MEIIDDDLCQGKKLLEDLLRERPELDELLERAIERSYEPRAKYAIVACYVCDGYNYNCPDYKNIKEVKKYA